MNKLSIIQRFRPHIRSYPQGFI